MARLTAYVGNESDVDVLFDDVQVEHRQGLQVQETQYDPTGLELAGLAPPSLGLRGLNQYKFNGKELQSDLGLNWTHQDWRFIDHARGPVWFGVDPEVENGQESMSPFVYNFNNAVRFSDPNGREPDGPGDPPATIRQRQPNGAEVVANTIDAVSNLPILGQFMSMSMRTVYNTVNDAYTMGSGVVHPGAARTMEGHGVNRNEYSRASFSTIMLVGSELVGAAGGAARGAEAAKGATTTELQAAKITARPGSFRKSTVTSAWDNAVDGAATNTKQCPTCGNDVVGNPNKGEKRGGPNGWDVSHNPSWSKRANSGKTRKEVLDNYNSGTELECKGCNRSRGNRDEQNPRVR